MTREQEENQQNKEEVVVAIRHYQADDDVALQLAANHVQVARHLRAIFPSPYTLQDAQWWINHVTTKTQNNNGKARTITVNGVVSGGVGLTDAVDDAIPESIYGVCEEVGYWLTPSCWGQGIVARALQLFVDKIREGHVPLCSGCQRLVTVPSNPRSNRVLEKCGFVAKEGETVDITQRDGTKSKAKVYRLDLKS